jgi:hypothetical protein
MNQVLLLGAFLISFVGLAMGLFLIKRPERVIELQKAFYLGINWKIEPVSVPREIASTRMMGLLLVIVCLLGVLLCLIRMPHVLICR